MRWHTPKHIVIVKMYQTAKKTRLDELYNKPFDEQVGNTLIHNSCYDVEVCAKCYFKCENKSV